VATLTGKQFFPHLISGPFHHGLVIVFSMAIALLVISAGASLLRGSRYVHDEHAAAGATAGTAGTSGPAEVTAEVAIGASPELAVEVAAEIDGEATRQAQREAEQHG
jgi:hypothetical protein